MSGIPSDAAVKAYVGSWAEFLDSIGVDPEDCESETPSCFGCYGAYFNCDCGCKWGDECLTATEEDEEKDFEDTDMELEEDG